MKESEPRAACFTAVSSILILGLLGLAALPAFGASAPVGAAAPAEGIVLEMVTITASEGESQVASSSTVSLLDRKAFDRFQFRSVSDALDTLAGVAIQRTYLKQRMLVSRGILEDMYANKNLVMIDGIPLWHAVTGEHNLDRVGLPELRRIETLKGPASVLYGSQAYSGAVNLVLRQPQPGERAGEAYGGVGTAGAWEGGLHTRIGLDNGLGLLVAANASRGSRSEFDFTDESGRSGRVTDFVDTSNLTVRASFRGHTLLANRYDHREGFLGATPSFAQGAGGRHDVEGAALAYKLKERIGDDWTVEALGFYDWNERDYTRTVATREHARIGGNRRGGGAKVSYAAAPNFTATLGGDYEHRFGKEFVTYTPTSAANGIPGRSVWERSALGQITWKHRAFNLIAGSRYSTNALSGDAITSRVTGVYRLDETRSLKLIAAQAFRSPSLAELYMSTSAVVGNTALRTESSDSLELAYIAHSGHLLLQALGYVARYEDKIFRGVYPANPAQNTYFNGDEFRAVGFELEARYSAPAHGDVFLNVDAVRGTDGDAVTDTANPGRTAYNFKYVPKWNAAAGLAKRFGPVSATVTARYTPAVDGPRARVGGFMLLDAAVAYEGRIGGKLVRHSLHGSNLLDEEVQFPEFSRRRINEVPLGAERGLFYRVSLTF